MEKQNTHCPICQAPDCAGSTNGGFSCIKNPLNSIGRHNIIGLTFGSTIKIAKR